MRNDLRLIPIPFRLERKIFLFLTSGVALTIPLKPSYNSLFCISLFACWLFFFEKKFTKNNIQIVLALSALFWIGLVSFSYTQNIGEGWFRLQQKSLLLVLPLVFGSITFDWRKEFRIIVNVFIITIIVTCIICFSDAILHLISQRSYERFFGHGLVKFINIYPYILALLCLISLLVLVETALGNFQIHPLYSRRWVQLTLILFFSIFILLLSVKQIILAWLILFCIYLLRIKFRRRIIIGMLISCFLLFFISFLLVPTLQTKLYEVIDGSDNTIPLDQDLSLGRNWNGIAIRKAIWTCSLDVIRENLFIGVGIGDAQDVLQSAYETRMFYFASRYNLYNAHSQYIQVLVNFGIVGFIIWFGCLLWLLNKCKSWLARCMLGCVMFMLLTESMFETNKGILILAFIVSLFLFGSSICTSLRQTTNS
ncbi:MAG: O-antigen ligase family protein [Cyclobacteriaceae bacterium]|nr:O-antigen ligase family protein [Cyclobacteriaceae bacterium]